MAEQDASPEEAAIAQAKLAEMGNGQGPPPPPTAVGAPEYDPEPWVRWEGTSSSPGVFTVTFTLRRWG